MFTAQITFPLGAETDREDLLVSVSSLLSAWYKNGQIVASTWPMAEGSSEIHAYPLIPDRDSLEEKHANRCRERLKEQAGAPPRVVLVGRDPESLDTCSCRLGASLAYRVEGLPRYDLIGGSHGWRRPGYEMFVEPGLAYSKGNSTFSLNVPIGVYRNREPNPYSGREGDATFPDYILLRGVSYRF